MPFVIIILSFSSLKFFSSSYIPHSSLSHSSHSNISHSCRSFEQIFTLADHLLTFVNLKSGLTLLMNNIFFSFLTVSTIKGVKKAKKMRGSSKMLQHSNVHSDILNKNTYTHLTSKDKA